MQAIGGGRFITPDLSVPTVCAQLQVSASPTALPSRQQPLNGPAESVAKGLMEKLALQEMLSDSLQQQLDEFPMDDGL